MVFEGKYYIKNYGNVVGYVLEITKPESLAENASPGTYLREQIDIEEINCDNEVKYRMHLCTPMNTKRCRTIEFYLNEPFEDFTLDGRPCETSVSLVLGNTLLFTQEVTNSSQVLFTLFEFCREKKSLAVALISSETGDENVVQLYVQKSFISVKLCDCHEISQSSRWSQSGSVNL